MSDFIYPKEPLHPAAKPVWGQKEPAHQLPGLPTILRFITIQYRKIIFCIVRMQNVCVPMI